MESCITARKVSKYGIFPGPYFTEFSPNTGKYGPEKTPYLDTFYVVNFWVYFAVFKTCLDKIAPVKLMRNLLILAKTMILSLQCLVSSKMSGILKQTSSFQPRICVKAAHSHSQFARNFRQLKAL